MNLSNYELSEYEGLEEDREDVMRERGELQKAEFVPLRQSGKVSKDDFRVIKVIGRGGFGKVYMVKKRSNGKVYAMKVLSKDQIAARNLSVKTKGRLAWNILISFS